MGDRNPGMRGSSAAPPGSEREGSCPRFRSRLGIMAGNRRIQGLNSPIPDRLSADSGTIHAFLNPRAAARTIGRMAESAGSTPVLALLRRSRHRRSTLGRLAP